MLKESASLSKSLTIHGEFISTVKSKWDEAGPIFHSRSALTLFHQKLKTLKSAMRAMNRSHYGDIYTKTKKPFEDLCSCQAQALSDPSPTTFGAE